MTVIMCDHYEYSQYLEINDNIIVILRGSEANFSINLRRSQQNKKEA